MLPGAPISVPSSPCVQPTSAQPRPPTMHPSPMAPCPTQRGSRGTHVQGVLQGLGELGCGGTVGPGVPTTPQQSPRLAGLPAPGTSPALSPLKGGLKGLHLLNIPRASVPGCVSKGTSQGAAGTDGVTRLQELGRRVGKRHQGPTCCQGLGVAPPDPHHHSKRLREGRWVLGTQMVLGMPRGAGRWSLGRAVAPILHPKPFPSTGAGCWHMAAVAQGVHAQVVGACQAHRSFQHPQ